MRALPGIVVGLAVGALVGILLAPESGKKTRKKVSRKISKESDSFFTNLQDQVNATLESVKSQYNDFVDNTSSKSKELLHDAKKKVSL